MNEPLRGSTSSKNGPTRDPVFVHDAPGLFAGLPLLLPGEHYTTPQVVEEVVDRESRERLERALNLGRLRVEKPSRLVEAHRGLSGADVSVLSLAIELRRRLGGRVVVVTDDYALQKEASKRGLEYMPVKTLGFEKADRLTGRGRRN